MRRKNLLCLGLVLLLLAPLCPRGYALKAEPEVVRVGFFAFSGYHEMAEDGRLSGYGYEFLQELAVHGDWTYTYLGYDGSYAQALDMLRRGEVDVVTSVSKTPEREEEFLFSDLPIGTNSTMFTVRAGDETVTAGDYASYDGMRIGMLEGNSKNDVFYRFSQEKGFAYTPVYYATEPELASALQEGQVDGAVSGSLRATENEWVLENLEASDFYIVTRKDRPDLMAEINGAIEEMNLHELDWRTALHTKYYATDSGGQVLLNAEERLWLEERLASGEPVKVLMNPDRAPYSYFSGDEAKGIFPEIFALLAGRLGLNYEILPVRDREEYYALRDSGQADVVLDYTSDYYLAESEGYKITDPYINVGFARLTRKNFTGAPATVATVLPSDILESYIQETYPDKTVLPFSCVEDCTRALLTGEADCAVLYAYTAEQAVLNDRQNRLTSTLLGDSTFGYSLGVSAGDGHLLLSALNKAAAGLSESERSGIVLRETDQLWEGRETDLIGFLYDNPAYALLAVFFLSVFVFVLALLVLRTNNQRRLAAKVDEVSRRYEAQKKELSEALVLADQANRSKTTFLNNMSHDIHTPMNAIIGYTALATTHLDNREQTQDYLAKIAQSSNHLLSLINDVLDMSRIESGHVHVEERPEDLAEILHGLRDIVQADVQAKQLEFFVDTVDVTEEHILCDRLRLNQILLNLLSNAIKFTKPGGTISLRVTQKPSQRKNHGIYEFRVKDTGIGMSPDFATHIFEPFTRERSSTVSGIQGTGLGMAITKNIVTMMNGTIQVNSRQNVGTEFIVTLELAFSGEKEEPVSLTELEGLRALVADDDLVSCQSVTKMLRQIGMRAEWTRYGKEAVIRAGEAHEIQDPFAVYIIDWSMPDQNGIETVRRIRQTVGDDAPIILFSAYDWTDIEGEARAVGVTGFISKPLFSSDLYKTLGRALGKGAGEDPAEQAETVRAREDFRGRRILLAEDNELNREIATELLTEAGFQVDCAENGRAACDMVSASRPGTYDLILMDIQMPVMNGYEATRAIRALEDPALAHIPVVAMTANAFEEDKQLASQAGMDGYLAKPIDIEKMFRVLGEILEKPEP